MCILPIQCIYPDVFLQQSVRCLCVVVVVVWFCVCVCGGYVCVFVSALFFAVV